MFTASGSYSRMDQPMAGLFHVLYGDAAGRLPMNQGVEWAGRAELADGRILKSRP